MSKMFLLKHSVVCSIVGPYNCKTLPLLHNKADLYLNVLTYLFFLLLRLRKIVKLQQVEDSEHWHGQNLNV